MCLLDRWIDVIISAYNGNIPCSYGIILYRNMHTGNWFTYHGLGHKKASPKINDGSIALRSDKVSKAGNRIIIFWTWKWCRWERREREKFDNAIDFAWCMDLATKMNESKHKSYKRNQKSAWNLQVLTSTLLVWSRVTTRGTPGSLSSGRATSVASTLQTRKCTFVIRKSAQVRHQCILNTRLIWFHVTSKNSHFQDPIKKP